MDKHYSLDRDDVEPSAEAKKLYLKKLISDIEDEPAWRREPYPVSRHTDMMPPTEFMALGLYPHQ